jgi:hypothetical protein
MVKDYRDGGRFYQTETDMTAGLWGSQAAGLSGWVRRTATRSILEAAAAIPAWICVLTLCSRALGQERVPAETPSEPVVRKAFGAGRWFPASRTQLERVVNDCMEKAEVPAVEGRIVAAVAPHAGYQYSGPVAGYAFRAIRDNLKGSNTPDVVVILGLSHRDAFDGVALMDGDAMETPLGRNALDRDAVRFLAEKSDRIRVNYSPHAGEHSAENEVPFVQAALPGVKLVIGLVGDHSEKTVQGLADALGGLAEKKRVLVIASSDMLHDPDYDLVTKTDGKSLKKAEALDDAGIWKEWSGEHQIFCGVAPVVAAMRFAKARGCRQGKVLRYRNTGDDHPESRGQWVVGYGAIVFAVSTK